MAAQSDERSPEIAPPPPPPTPTARTWLFGLTSRQIWPAVRVVLGVGVVRLALWALSSPRGELSGFSQVFLHLKWWWIPPALLVEAASFVCFAGMQYELLRSGGLAAPEGP